jgi:hypothetical protein
MVKCGVLAVMVLVHVGTMLTNERISIVSGV